MLALGTWKSPPEQTKAAVKFAIKECGYRYIDTANDYGNEKDIGDALRELFQENVVTREELFIQSKLWNTNHRREHVEIDLKATLDDLQLDYIDSYIIHWPQAMGRGVEAATFAANSVIAKLYDGKSPMTMFPVDEQGYIIADTSCHFMETWYAMEDLVDRGLVKSIGISNFNSRQIKEVAEKKRKHPISVLQNECHPYLQQKDLLDLCKILKIQFQAYSPLGSRDRPPSLLNANEPTLLEDPDIKKLAKVHGKSPAQIVLRWQIQRGVACVAKSVHYDRIRENMQIFDFSLSDEEMHSFDKLNIGYRYLPFAATSNHPDYPFKDELPHDYVLEKCPFLPKDHK